MENYDYKFVWSTLLQKYILVPLCQTTSNFNKQTNKELDNGNTI